MEKKAFGRANYIKEITRQWKQAGGQWRNGELPSVLTRGETYLLKTTVIDADGISSCPYVEIIRTDDVPVPDVKAPRVAIESPAPGARIAGPVDIVGSIYDDIRIAEYSISYDNGSGKKGSMTYTDTENKSSQKLGAIDFSNLPNGTYTIRVTAMDEWENMASASVGIINAYPLIKLTDVTADEEYVYVHGRINQINELAETTYSYKNPEEDNEIPVTGNEEAQEKGKYIGFTKDLEIQEPKDNGYFDGNIMSEEEILFRIPLSQMESGIYTFHAKAKDKNGISTDAAIKAELIKKSTDPAEDETVTEQTSSIELQFNSVELVEVEEGNTATAANQAADGEQATAQGDETVSDNDAERPESPAGETSDGEMPAGGKETCVRIQGTYESTDEITEKAFELKNTETNAAIPFELQMENGRVVLTARASQMGQGDFEATGRLKNSYGCEAYAAMEFQLSGGEDNKDITVEETPNQNQGAFPSISAISFHADRTLVQIHGDRAGYEHTVLTCENVANGKKVNVKECDDNGIIGTMYSSDFENGQYKVTLTVYDSKGTVLGMASILFTYTKGGQGGSVSDNTVSDNTVSDNSTDKTPPVIEMEIEDEDYILTEAANITGSIYDETALKEYTVTIIPEGEEAGTVIRTGTEEIREDIIAAIDPTTLANGRYKAVIEAEDKVGNRKTSSLGFTVDSRLKIGNMNIGFTDLVAKLPFGSLNLQRFYNSNNKTCGDFGYGWTMGLTGMTLKENSDISKGYEQIVSGTGMSTSYHIRETANHDITVHYGDGTSDRFRLTLSPNSSGLVPIRLVKVGFTCQTSQGVTLELAGDNSAGLEGGMLLWEDESKFDEIKYILTTKDKTKVYLTAEKGVYKIEDSLGNVVTVDQDGYHGEGNKGITLTRNEEGLITSATDGNGKTVSYGYDENKDLVSFTNEAGHSIRFTYDGEHNLASIIDPMGVATARNEYDENGRLIVTIDAEGNRMEYAYDVEGRTQAVQDRRGNTTVHTYDENGNILKTVDALGNATYNTYDGYGNLLTATDGNGNTTSYTYDGNGNVTTVTDAEGNTTTSQYNTRNQITSLQNSDDARLLISYDERGRLSQTTDNDGNRTDYAYTSAGKLASISDAIGTVTAYTYDQDGNVIKTRDGNGNETSYLYNEAGKCSKAVTTRTTAEGVVQSETSYIYDASGNLIQTQDGEGRITKAEYDPCGRLCRSIDPEGRTTTYSHTATGELSAIHYDDGTSESFTYDEEGNLLSSTDRLGKTVRHAYDKAGNLAKTTDGLGNETTYEYDRAYRLTKVNRPTGATTEYEYDRLGRNTKILSSDGSAIHYAYDGAGNLTSMTDALGNTTRYEYDNLGNRCGIILPDGSGIKTAYDARGRITSQTDASGNRTTYGYDNNDNLTRVTDAYNRKTEYTYNEAGELTCIKDADDNCTYYEYNKNGEITRTTRADGLSYTYEYDQYGRLGAVTTYGGETIAYEYTNHLLTKTTAGEEVTTYEYDGLERLISVCNKEGKITYEYDSYGRVSARTTAAGEKLTYGYDAYGRLNRTTTSAGTTEYTYDAYDRLTSVATADGTTAYTYDRNGNKASQSNPNGTTISYGYDSCNRLTEETVRTREGKVLASYGYTYNKNGQKITATEEAGGSRTESEYSYDALNRLIKETTKITSREGGERTERTAYTYDAVGNRIKKLQDGAIYQYEYNNLNQLTKEKAPDGETIYQYDADGNLTFRGTGNRGETYTYSVDGKLLSYKDNTGATVTEEAYTYDGEGNRLSKEETAGNVRKKTYYVTDNRTGYSQVVLELDGGKEVQAAYGRGDSLLTVRTGEGTKTYITDGHGDVRYLTDEEGNITDSYRYSAYGELIEKSGNTRNPYLYCGEYYDEGTGLYYLRARYMRPSTGTFISMDSYQGNAYDPASLHRYTYAQNNPQMYNDPSGHFIATVQMCINSAYNSFLSNYNALNVIGMISGVMNTTVNQLLGGEDDPVEAYMKGYAAGIVIGGIYCGACAIAAIYQVAELVHLGIFSYLSVVSINELTLALCAGAVGNNKAALVHTVLAVLCVGGAMYELSLTGVISVTGPKGTVEVDIKGKANKGSGKIKVNDLPENVQNSFNKYEEAGWKGNVSGQTPGTNAGRRWGNRDAQLPTADANGNPITYREFDVNNFNGVSRDVERFVVGSDGTVWYTDSHYGQGTSLNGIDDFIQIKWEN